MDRITRSKKRKEIALDFISFFIFHKLYRVNPLGPQYFILTTTLATTHSQWLRLPGSLVPMTQGDGCCHG